VVRTLERKDTVVIRVSAWSSLCPHTSVGE
jgi:hypothetical protein